LIGAPIWPITCAGRAISARGKLMLERLLDEFDPARMGGMKVARDGSFALTFDDTITVNIEHDAQLAMLTFFCRLGTVEPARAAEIYPLLLEANVLWAGTGGATLGVMPEDRSVLLCYQEADALMTGPRFAVLLRGFVDVAEFWMGRIQGQAPQPADEQPVPDGWIRF